MESDENDLEKLLARKKKLDERLYQFQQSSYLSEDNVESKETHPIYDLYVIENEAVVYLDLELPGVFEENIDIKLVPPYLTVKGQFSSLLDIPGCVYLENKRKRGSFEYRFWVVRQKSNIGQETKYEYQLKNGILHLKIQQQPAPKQLPSTT